MRIKKFIATILATMMLSSSVLQAFALETENYDVNSELIKTATADEVDTVEGNYGWVEDTCERLGTGFERDTVELALSYDPRDYGYATKTKGQSPFGLCWMYSTIGAVEQYISKNYGSHLDISEAHGAVSNSNSIIPIGSDGTGYYKNVADTGSRTIAAISYLTNWNTPILDENTVRWNSMVLQEDYSKEKLVEKEFVALDDDFSKAESLFNVTDTKYLDESEDTIKYAVKNYGGVIVDMHGKSSALYKDINGEYNYYTGSAILSPNHSVVIVGWDDNYSKDNFKEGNKPTTDGAWLVRNTWYSSDIRNYMWMSYEELSIYHDKARRIVVTGMQKDSDDEYMLSYDYKTLHNKEDYYFDDTVYLCNVYDVSNYTDVYDKINKVMMYLKSTGCTYKVRIIQIDENDTMPENIDDYSVLASGDFRGEGHITVDLDYDFEFTSENKCAVIVELIPENTDSKIYVPYAYSSTDKISYGQSLIGTETDLSHITWSDCKNGKESEPNGYLSIRPVLVKAESSSHNVNILPNEIVDNDTDVNLLFDTDCKFLCVRTKSGKILREKRDYNRTEKGVRLEQEYIDSLNGEYTELLFEFTNDVTKSIIINPKACINNITLYGEAIVGETLSATIDGEPEKDVYDVSYQWQVSDDGISWDNISDANSNTYVISKTYRNRYIRVSVTSEKYGNVVYPYNGYSLSTECRVVILGDVDLDGVISIKDSTLISKYAVNIVANFNKEQLLAADVNKDGRINVMDATEVQKIIAGIGV